MKFLQIASLLASASAGYGENNHHSRPFSKSEVRDIKGLKACHDDFLKDQDLDEL